MLVTMTSRSIKRLTSSPFLLEHIPPLSRTASIYLSLFLRKKRVAAGSPWAGRSNHLVGWQLMAFSKPSVSHLCRYVRKRHSREVLALMAKLLAFTGVSDSGSFSVQPRRICLAGWL